MDRATLEAMTPQQLTKAHADLDEQIRGLRAEQGQIHDVLTLKEHEREVARAAGRVQTIGGKQ